MNVKMFFLPLYFGIIFSGVICLSNSTLLDNDDEKVNYNEFQKCINIPWRKFDRFLKSMKTSVDPCIDFYEYGCGNWRKNYSMPVNYEKWSTFKQIQHETLHRVHELLIQENEYDKLPFIKTAKQYYRSCMNEEGIEDMGADLIKFLMKAAGGWPILMSDQQWEKKNYTWQNTYNIYNELYGLSNIFSLVYEQEELGKTHKVFQIFHSLKHEETLLENKCHNANVDTIIKIVQAFAADERIYIPIERLRADVNEIITFERNLRQLISKERKTKVTRMTIAALQDLYDSFTKTRKSSAKINWLDMIQSSFKDNNIIINSSESVLVDTIFLRGIAVLLGATSPRIIVNYMQWNMVCRLMKYVNSRVRNIVSDCPNCDVKKPRWLKCVQDDWMQDITSYLYVKTYFSADVSNTVSEMVNELKAEIKELISLSSVMDNVVKNYMMNQVDKVLSYIGYPKWYDNQTIFINLYEGLKLGDSYFKNLLEVAKHEGKIYARRKNLKNMYSWPIYPTKVAAMYVRARNVIVIPAAIIQDPFFTSNRPPALNYGALGFIIGHELGHSLDLSKNKGWKCLIDYYNNITLGVTHDKGKPIRYGNTAARENIADIIGLQAAFAAFKKHTEKTWRQSKLWTMDLNVTDKQLFFLSLTSIFCTTTNISDIIRKVNNKNIVQQLIRHSPNKFRIIGSFSSTRFLREGFKCPVGSPMNPESKCEIWE